MGRREAGGGVTMSDESHESGESAGADMPAASPASSAYAAPAPPAGRTARGAAPLRRLTVLYDPQCRLCAHIGSWLPRQRQLVPLDLVPAGSAEAWRRFPALDHAATRAQVTVVGDGGQVYLGDTAWVVVLWALADHRAFSHTLTTPMGRRLARAAALSAAKYREYGRRPAWEPARGPVRPWPAAAPCADRCAPPG